MHILTTISLDRGDTMKRWILFLIVIMLLSGVPVGEHFVSATENTIKIYPMDDAYVKSTEPDENYGSWYSLYVGTYWKDNANERAYLKFDLSSIPTNARIISATLHAYTYKGAYSVPVNISVYEVTDDSWTEGTITWNNKPLEGNLLDKDLIGTEGEHWSVWDVTDFVKNEFSGDKVVSFVLISDAEGLKTESIGYSSKETTYSGQEPYLKLVYEIPETPQEPVVKYPKRGISSIQYFYYLRYKEAIEKFDELYQKATESGADEETLKQALEYKKLAEKEYELAWQFGHPLKGHIQTFVHMRKAFLNIKEALEILGISNVTETPTQPTEVVRVLIDASHNQYYNDQKLMELMKKIKKLGWAVDANHQKPLTEEILSNYSILIITNPRDIIPKEEAQIIKAWVKEGGGLLITGDWYEYVEYVSLNRITEEFGIKFNDDELMDNEQNTGYQYFPLVGEFNFDHPTIMYLSESSQLYYNGDTLDVSGNAVWLIRGYETSYAEGENNEISKEKGSKPIVAAAVEVGNGRIVAYGSSKAISDDYYGRYIDSNWPFLKGVLLWLAGEI